MFLELLQSQKNVPTGKASRQKQRFRKTTPLPMYYKIIKITYKTKIYLLFFSFTFFVLFFTFLIAIGKDSYLFLFNLMAFF